ncbi:MAG TPA: pentapeptide repeat-containing protein [Devosia sp.]|jgi:uncharacterized protein YjbI with pentapeptide repeats|nr:pentapeptide repeat-containing protein [Devosia sp.]
MFELNRLPKPSRTSRRPLAVAALCFAAMLGTGGATAQEARGAEDQHLPSVWDLTIGAHWSELPVRDFIDYACGTNGGPPSKPIATWSEFATCPAEAEGGWHEVYFEYDDEQEYIGRARNLDLQVMRHEFTWVNGIPVIASALFDDDGFLVGVRLVTDPRVEDARREKGMVLGGFMKARYGESGWACEDLPRAERESAFLDIFVKQTCEKTVTIGEAGEVNLHLDIRNLRGPGQTTLAYDNVPTEGEFESSTRFEAVLAGPVPDKEQKLAALEGVAQAVDPTVAKAMDCPGCDLQGVNLKRANLTGANLAGANLTGANFHGAILAQADLTGAILTDANLNRADLRRAKLSGANLQKVMAYGATIEGADLSKADLKGAMAGSSRLTQANLTDAKVRAVDFRGSRLNGVNFTGADLSYTWMQDAQATRANFSDAIMLYVDAKRANFADAKLPGVDARGGDFFGASFREADLTSADFSFTRLATANLYSATLEGTKFEESELPAGFRAP